MNKTKSINPKARNLYMDKFIMSYKEREQLKVMERLEKGQISQKVAAQILKITTRWVREKVKRYRLEGDNGLIHKNRGEISPNRWDESEKITALNLIKSDWHGFGPTFAAFFKEYKMLIDANKLQL